MKPIDERAREKDPELRDEIGALGWLFGAAAPCALSWGWDEESFVRIARWFFRREEKQRNGFTSGGD